ncbi:hypothetical protein IAD21_02719 [Abditibacteriota bacterium]|nr:hypothetical protein IAD21_02719 [Abditibacteriota bacterium]
MKFNAGEVRREDIDSLTIIFFRTGYQILSRYLIVENIGLKRNYSNISK